MHDAVLARKSGEEAIKHVFGPEKNGNVRRFGFRVCPIIHPLVENRKKYEAELLDKNAERTKMIVEQTLAEKLQKAVENLVSSKYYEGWLLQWGLVERKDEGFRDTLPSIFHLGNKHTLESTSKASAPYFPKNVTSKSISRESVEQLGDQEISRSIPKACSQLPGNKTRSENSSKESIMVPMKTSQSQRINIGQPCILFLFHESNIIAEGTLISTSTNAILHNGAMDKGCYKVSIDKVIKEYAYLPCPTKEFIMVVDAYKSFVAWPSQYIKML